MSRTSFSVAVAAAIAIVACSHDHGAPRVRSTPHVDGSPALRNGAPRSPRIANYKINARLDAASHQVAGTETLTWTNTGQTPVDALPFHLYLNAFKNEASLFMRTSGGVMRGARAADNGWGWITVDSVTIGGVELVGTLHSLPPDDTVAELPLPAPVAPGAQIEVTFAFTAQLPEVFARTGYKGDFHMVAQWFPKIGVRVGAPGLERWECQPLHANTEFFADFGTYDVTLTVPTTHVVAATGVLINATESPGGTRTLTYHAEDVHDFVWMADPFMDVLKGTAKLEDGSVEVRVYYRAEQREMAHRHLDAAIGTIERMSTWFLPYPWSEISIVDPPLDAAEGAGGMEYETLVTTAGDTVFARPGLRLPEYVTVHEVVHNWFQGVLASDEANEAWLDEGVNEWVDTKVMDDLYGARTSAIDWAGWQADIGALRRAVASDPGSVPSPIATAAYAFSDGAAYASAEYETTMRTLGTLERMVGNAPFMAAIRTYVRAFAFKHPTGADLFATLSHELGQDLSWFFGPAFTQVGALELGVRSASCRPAHADRGVFEGSGGKRKVVTETEAPDSGAWRCTVIVTSTGAVHVPIDIEFRFADGSSARDRWDDRGALDWHRFDLERSARLVEVRLDPDGKVLLDQPIDHALRLDGDGAASLRAASRIASWAQTLMQMVGP